MQAAVQNMSVYRNLTLFTPDIATIQCMMKLLFFAWFLSFLHEKNLSVWKYDVTNKKNIKRSKIKREKLAPTSLLNIWVICEMAWPQKPRFCFMIISTWSGLAAPISIFKCYHGEQDHSKLLEHWGIKIQRGLLEVPASNHTKHSRSSM